MPIPTNWLEELVAEWLGLDGFLVKINPPVRVPGVRGAPAPDVVGGRVTGGVLEIRHCEAAMWPAGSARDEAAHYALKFQPKIQADMVAQFSRLFGTAPSAQPSYEQWVIFGRASGPVIEAITFTLPQAKVVIFESFIRNYILPTIARWNSQRPGAQSNVPQPNWLLCLLDWLRYRNLLKP